MKQVQGIWLPNGDTHFSRHFQQSKAPMHKGAATYQLHKLQAAMQYVKNPHSTAALDIGSHVGLWTRVLADRFAHVYCFEPLQEHIDCWQANVPQANVTIHKVALGTKHGTANMAMPLDNTGHSHVAVEGEAVVEQVDLRPLSHYRFLHRPSLVKIDVEGFELQVVRGGVDVLLEYTPVVIVEQKPNNAEAQGDKQRDALAFLLSLGMKERALISGDHILSW